MDPMQSQRDANSIDTGPSEQGAANTEAGRLVCAYVQSFNARDAQGMAEVFAPDLLTVHPAEPSLDVTSAAPFLERMRALWPRELYYTLRRFSERPLNERISEAWAELVIGVPGQAPLAAEVVIYRASEGRVVQLTVYKLMHPDHADYQPGSPR